MTTRRARHDLELTCVLRGGVDGAFEIELFFAAFTREDAQLSKRDLHLADVEGEVLAVAERITKMPTDVVRLNKRTVHRAMEVMGLRTAIRAGTELCALGIHTDTMAEFMRNEPK